MKKNTKKKNQNRPNETLSTLLDVVKPSKPETLDITKLKKREKDIDLNPYYQRQVVWTEPYKKNLIASILSGVPINVLHLVVEEKPGSNPNDKGEKYIVLDGKQRLTSIFGFLSNEFSIALKPFPEEVTYAALENMASNPSHDYHETAKTVLRKLEDYNIMVLYWTGLTLPQQSAVFNAINFSVELSKDEKVLAAYFYSKIFIKFLMDHYFKSVASLSKSKDDNRSRDLVWSLRLFYIIMGGHSKMVDISPELISKMEYQNGFEDFLKELHTRIELYLEQNKNKMLNSFDSATEMNKMLLSFGWLDDLKSLQKFIDDIGKKIIQSPPNGRKNVSDWITIYFTSFVLNKYHKDILRYGLFF